VLCRGDLFGIQPKADRRLGVGVAVGRPRGFRGVFGDCHEAGMGVQAFMGMDYLLVPAGVIGASLQ
jgi:hypothetical protein